MITESVLGFLFLDDYTVVCRRVIENDTNVVALKSIVAGNGAFIFEYANNATYSLVNILLV